MTEEEAQSWIETQFGERKRAALESFARLVCEENATQNLIAPSTLSSIWARHIVDSAQLLMLARDGFGTWLDIGSGAGFPGLIVAVLSDHMVTLVEPRRRRADFLASISQALKIESRVIIMPHKVDSLEAATPYGTISARAVASLTDLFAAAHKCSCWNTQWILPKGRSATAEIANAKRAWHGTFHVKQSITDKDSMIVVATQVRPR